MANQSISKYLRLYDLALSSQVVIFSYADSQTDHLLLQMTDLLLIHLDCFRTLESKTLLWSRNYIYTARLVAVCCLLPLDAAEPHYLNRVGLPSTCPILTTRLTENQTKSIRLESRSYSRCWGALSINKIHQSSDILPSEELV